MRATEAQRHTEALGVAHRGVGTYLSRLAQQGQPEQVGGHGDLGASLVRLGDQPGVVTYRSGCARVAQQQAEEVAIR